MAKDNSNNNNLDKIIKNILSDDLSFKEADNQLVELFGVKAEKIAKELEGDIKTTQFRKFYEKVLELNEKASTLKDEEFNIKIKPFIKMLNSKVQYSNTRKRSGIKFVTLMRLSIEKVNSVEELQNFKYFLESIIGFMPKK